MSPAPSGPHPAARLEILHRGGTVDAGRPPSVLGVRPARTTRGRPGPLRVGHRGPPPSRRSGRRVNRLELVSAALRRQLAGTNSVDEWGMDPDAVQLARFLTALRWRTEVVGAELVPREARRCWSRTADRSTPPRCSWPPPSERRAIGRSASPASRTSRRSDRSCAAAGASSPGRTRSRGCCAPARSPPSGARPDCSTRAGSVRRRCATWRWRSTSACPSCRWRSAVRRSGARARIEVGPPRHGVATRPAGHDRARGAGPADHPTADGRAPSAGPAPAPLAGRAAAP